MGPVPSSSLPRDLKKCFIYEFNILLLYIEPKVPKPSDKYSLTRNNGVEFLSQELIDNTEIFQGTRKYKNKEGVGR